MRLIQPRHIGGLDDVLPLRHFAADVRGILLGRVADDVVAAFDQQPPHFGLLQRGAYRAVQQC